LKIITPTVFYNGVVDCTNATGVFAEKVMPLARASPEMGAIAAQAYYEINHFVVDAHTVYTPLQVRRKPKLPPPAAAKHIRDLFYHMSMDWHSFSLMGRIVRGKYPRFENLTKVRIVIQTRADSILLPNMTKAERDSFKDAICYGGPLSALQVLTHGEKITFSGKGTVQTKDYPVGSITSMIQSIRELWQCEWMQNQVYDLMQDSISFQKN